jgi:hypothetical protein
VAHHQPAAVNECIVRHFWHRLYRPYAFEEQRY